MPNVMPCGHNDVWMFRVRDRGRVYRYCLKCLFDKTGMEDVYSKPTSEETEVKPKVKEDKLKKKKYKK